MLRQDIYHTATVRISVRLKLENSEQFDCLRACLVPLLLNTRLSLDRGSATKSAELVDTHCSMTPDHIQLR